MQTNWLNRYLWLVAYAASYNTDNTGYFFATSRVPGLFGGVGALVGAFATCLTNTGGGVDTGVVSSSSIGSTSSIS